MTEGFADSTIAATVWLIRWHPERLKDWLAKHPPGEKLERIARARIKPPPVSRAAAERQLHAALDRHFAERGRDG